MTASAQPAQAAVTATPLELITGACRERLRKLSKEGGVSDSWTLVGVFAFAMVVAGALTLFFRANYNATDIDSATRGWIRLAYWIALPATPAFLLAALWSMLRALRTKAAPSFSLKCPSCGTTHELSALHAKKFTVACDKCFALTSGSADAHSVRARCEYCAHEYFGSGGASSACPSCRRAGAATEAKCRHCSKAIPRGAVFCVHCEEWLGEPESGFDSGTASYDVTRFGSRAARIYAVAIWKRVEPVAIELDAIVKSAKDVATVGAGEWGRIGAGLSEPKMILPKLALAVAWMRRPGATTTETLPVGMVEGLRTLEAAVVRCNAAGMKLTDELRAIALARRFVAGD